MKGSLEEHSVFELFEELAGTRATGTLTVTRKKQEIQLDWLKGKIINVVEKPNFYAGTLGELLLHIGEISEVQLEQAILQQKRSLSPLGLILQNLFACDHERIRFVLRVQAIETLYSLFFWQSGTFEFAASTVLTPNKNYDAIDVVDLLDEAIPVIEAWETIRKYFPDPLLNVSRLTDEIPAEEMERLDELTQVVFDLIGEGATYRELSILSGAGQFSTAYALIQLLQLGFIRLEPPKKKKLEWKRLLFGMSLSHFFVWLVVSTLLVFGGTFLLAFAPYSPLRLWRPRYQYEIVDQRWYDGVDHWRKLRIQQALEHYKLTNGHYPSRLELLVKDGWLTEELIHFPAGNVYHYRCLCPNRYRLLDPLP